jgi:hypothetical protein
MISSEKIFEKNLYAFARFESFKKSFGKTSKQSLPTLTLFLLKTDGELQMKQTCGGNKFSRKKNCSISQIHFCHGLMKCLFGR